MFFMPDSELRLKSKCYDEDIWQRSLNYWSAEQKRKKRVNSGNNCYTARYRHKSCACHTNSAQIPGRFDIGTPLRLRDVSECGPLPAPSSFEIQLQQQRLEVRGATCLYWEHLEDLPAGALLKISMILCNDQNNPSKEAGISISASWRYTYGGKNGFSIPQNIIVHVDQLYILTHVPSSHRLCLVFWKIAQDTLPQAQPRSHLQSTNIR